MSQSYGPTMIIDRCESSHALAPATAWDSPSSSGTLSRSERHELEHLLDLEAGDDERSSLQLSLRASLQSLSNHPLPTMLPPQQQKQQQQGSNQYGSMRHRNNATSNTPGLKLSPRKRGRDSIRFQGSFNGHTGSILKMMLVHPKIN